MSMPEMWDDDIFMAQEDREYFDSLLLEPSAMNSDEDMVTEEDYVSSAIPDFTAF